MRKQTQDDLKKIDEQIGLLKGNINRMCVTDSLEELRDMDRWAKARINQIVAINYCRLTEQESADEKMLNSDWGEMEVHG